jgi:hypothetical protein
LIADNFPPKVGAKGAAASVFQPSCLSNTFSASWRTEVERHNVGFMDVHVEHAYAAAPDVVFSMLTNREFLLERFDATGALEYEVLECNARDGGGFRVVTRRKVEAEIPSLARKVLKPVNTMVQTELWNSGADGVYSGEWSIDAKGTPVSTSGTMRLVATDTGSLNRIDGKIKVGVPLIGGKIESFVFDQARKTLDAEEQFGQRWLSEHHTP